MQVANRLLAHLLPPIFRRLYPQKICWWTSHKWTPFSFRQVPCKWIYMRALTRHDPRNFQFFWWNPQGCTSKDPNFFSKHPQKKAATPPACAASSAASGNGVVITGAPQKRQVGSSHCYAAPMWRMWIHPIDPVWWQGWPMRWRWKTGQRYWKHWTFVSAMDIPGACLNFVDLRARFYQEFSDWGCISKQRCHLDDHSLKGSQVVWDRGDSSSAIRSDMGLQTETVWIWWLSSYTGKWGSITTCSLAASINPLGSEARRSN